MALNESMRAELFDCTIFDYYYVDTWLYLAFSSKCSGMCLIFGISKVGFSRSSSSVTIWWFKLHHEFPRFWQRGILGYDSPIQGPLSRKTSIQDYNPRGCWLSVIIKANISCFKTQLVTYFLFRLTYSVIWTRKREMDSFVNNTCKTCMVNSLNSIEDVFEWFTCDVQPSRTKGSIGNTIASLRAWGLKLLISGF